MNKNLFGKTMDNMKDHKNIKLVTNREVGRYSKDDNRPLSLGKNKKTIGMMEDELGRKIMVGFFALRAKMFMYRKLHKKFNDKC